MCLTEVVHFMDSCSFSGTWITLMNSFFLPPLPTPPSFSVFNSLMCSVTVEGPWEVFLHVNERLHLSSYFSPFLENEKQDEKPTRVGAGFSEILWWRQHWWRRTKWGGPGTPIRSGRLFTGWVAIGVWRTADLCLLIWIQRSFWNFYFFSFHFMLTLFHLAEDKPR